MVESGGRCAATTGKVNEVMSIYRVTVKAVYEGTDAQYNVHHYEFPGYVPDDTELAEFVDGLASIYDTDLIGRFTASVVFNSMEVRRVDVGNLPSADIVPTGWPEAGTNGSGNLPPQVSAMLRFSAPEQFPRTGRVYLPVFGQDQCNSIGRILAAAITPLNNAALAMEEIPVTGQVDAQKVAVSYSGSPRVVSASNVLFGQPTRNIFQTQRRRTPGVGI